ncbi:hypothetical protein [Candidatus Methylomirabilis limnetica]|uniref:hypothetical protein n=1 Tax=Candidatus Methylomirabilis limnetica TaxID=2033718 RepID=UPI0018753A32|nr:hypothetical protein [Candidatus Methylomirabilis limnetica]
MCSAGLFDGRFGCLVRAMARTLRAAPSAFRIVPLARVQNHGFSAQELNQIRTVIKANLQKIQEAWREHCG